MENEFDCCLLKECLHLSIPKVCITHTGDQLGIGGTHLLIVSPLGICSLVIESTQYDCNYCAKGSRQRADQTGIVFNSTNQKPNNTSDDNQKHQ